MSTYNDASLIYYPSGYKAGKAYSLKPTDGSGDLDFTRASTATRVNEQGLIESIATGVPRIDYTGGGCGKLLLEPQRTNYITYSNYDASTWTQTTASISINSATSPDGTTNAHTATRTSGSTQRIGVAAFSATVGQPYTNSIYLRKVSGSGLVRLIDINNTPTTFTLTTEWVRYSVTAIAVASTQRLYVEMTQDGDVIEFWQGQIENGSYSTSLIPTTSTAVTRVKDETSTTIIPTMTGVSEFTWFFDNTDMDVLVSVVVYMQLNLSGGALRYYSTNGGRFRGSTYFGDVPAKGKVAVKCDGTTLSMFKNGVKSASTLASALGTFVNFSGFNQGGETFSGGMQSMILFPTALSDDEIIALTTI